MSLAERWKEYRESLTLQEPTWSGIKAAFYAGAEAALNKTSGIDQDKIWKEIEAFKKGATP